MDHLHHSYWLKPGHVSENVQQYFYKKGIEMRYSLNSREYSFSKRLEMRYSFFLGEYNFSKKIGNAVFIYFRCIQLFKKIGNAVFTSIDQVNTTFQFSLHLIIKQILTFAFG